jgi:hypothetical protein
MKFSLLKCNYIVFFHSFKGNSNKQSYRDLEIKWLFYYKKA